MWFYIFSTIIIGTVSANLNAEQAAILEAPRRELQWEVNNFTLELQQQCYNTGNAEIFNKLQSTGALDSCKDSIIAYYDTVLKAMESDHIEEVHERAIRILPTVCKMLENANSTCPRVAEELMPCLSGNDRSVGVLNVILLIKPLAQYACNGGGKLIQSFIQNGDVECIKENSFYLLGCEPRMEEMRIPFLKEQQCNQIEEAGRCVTRIVDHKCNKPLIMDFMLSMVTVAWRSTPCLNFTKLNASVTAQTKVDDSKDIQVQVSNSTVKESTDCISVSSNVLSTLHTIEKKLQQDDLDSFGQYLVSTLRVFNREQRVLAKADIQKILTEYELKSINSKLPSQPHEFSYVRFG